VERVKKAIAISPNPTQKIQESMRRKIVSHVVDKDGVRDF